MRKVFITGGANGIGRALVEKFALAGYKVAFCDIDETAGRKLEQDSHTLFFHIDIRKKNELEDGMQTIFRLWGDIDILINNAGMSTFAPITESEVEEFDNILFKPAPRIHHVPLPCSASPETVFPKHIWTYY